MSHKLSWVAVAAGVAAFGVTAVTPAFADLMGVSDQILIVGPHGTAAQQAFDNLDGTEGPFALGFVNPGSVGAQNNISAAPIAFVETEAGVDIVSDVVGICIGQFSSFLCAGAQAPSFIAFKSDPFEVDTGGPLLLADFLARVPTGGVVFEDGQPHDISALLSIGTGTFQSDTVAVPGLILASGGLLGWWRRRQKAA